MGHLGLQQRTPFLYALSVIANATWFWLFISLDLSHKVLPRVPFTNHFRQNACSPNLSELGQNIIPVLFLRQNSLVKKKWRHHTHQKHAQQSHSTFFPQ